MAAAEPPMSRSAAAASKSKTVGTRLVLGVLGLPACWDLTCFILSASCYVRKVVRWPWQLEYLAARRCQSVVCTISWARIEVGMVRRTMLDRSSTIG